MLATFTMANAVADGNKTILPSIQCSNDTYINYPGVRTSFRTSFRTLTACESVAAALNELSGIDNVTCSNWDDSDFTLALSSLAQCNTVAKALNELSGINYAGCKARDVYGVLNFKPECDSQAAHLTSCLRSGTCHKKTTPDTTIPPIQCNEYYNYPYLPTPETCDTVATALNELSGIDNVSCYFFGYTYSFALSSLSQCTTVAKALNELSGIDYAGCYADKYAGGADGIAMLKFDPECDSQVALLASCLGSGTCHKKTTTAITKTTKTFPSLTPTTTTTKTTAPSSTGSTTAKSLTFAPLTITAAATTTLLPTVAPCRQSKGESLATMVGGGVLDTLVLTTVALVFFLCGVFCGRRGRSGSANTPTQIESECVARYEPGYHDTATLVPNPSFLESPAASTI